MFAVPGHPFDARAAGCNMLIRDGAPLIRSAQDVLDLIAEPMQTTRAPPSNMPSSPPSVQLEADDILCRLTHDPIPEDHLIRSLGATPAAVAPLLIDLELDGQIVRNAGGLLARAV